MRPLGIVLRGRFLFVTTYEKKYGFLLIEVFRTLFNTKNYGHQDSIFGGLFYLSGLTIIPYFGQSDHPQTMRED